MGEKAAFPEVLHVAMRKQMPPLIAQGQLTEVLLRIAAPDRAV